METIYLLIPFVIVPSIMVAVGIAIYQYKVIKSESFEKSIPNHVWHELQDKKRFDEHLKRISETINKNVRKFNYKNR